MLHTHQNLFFITQILFAVRNDWHFFQSIFKRNEDCRIFIRVLLSKLCFQNNIFCFRYKRVMISTWLLNFIFQLKKRCIFRRWASTMLFNFSLGSTNYTIKFPRQAFINKGKKLVTPVIIKNYINNILHPRFQTLNSIYDYEMFL